MNAMLIDKNNAVPFLEMLENISTATNNSIKISVTDLSKMKTSAAKKPIVQESDAESTKDLQKEDQAQKTAQAKNTPPDFSNQLGFSIELAGSYDSLIDFFTKLENIPFFVQVYNFQMSPDVKNKTNQAAVGGVVPVSNAGNKSIGAVEEESNDLKTTIIIGVYTNATK